MKTRFRSRGHIITWPRLLAFASACLVSFLVADYLGAGEAEVTLVPDWSENGFVAYSGPDIANGYGAMGGYAPVIVQDIGAKLEEVPIPTDRLWSFLGAEKVTFVHGGPKELTIVRTKNPDTFVVRFIWLIKAIFPGTNTILLPDKSNSKLVSAEFSRFSAETSENGGTTLSESSDEGTRNLLHIYEGEGFVIITDGEDRGLSGAWIPADIKLAENGGRIISPRLDSGHKATWFQTALLTGFPHFMARGDLGNARTLLNGLIYLGSRGL